MGKLDLKLSFSKLISDCRKFLQENPSEFILFSLKKEGEDHESDLSFEQCFCEIIKTEMSLWFLGNYIPTLDEVRGKCVLVRRFPLSRTNLDTLGIGIVFGEDTVFEYKFNEDPLQYVYCEDKYVIRGGELSRCCYTEDEVYQNEFRQSYQREEEQEHSFHYISKLYPLHQYTIQPIYEDTRSIYVRVRTSE